MLFIFLISLKSKVRLLQDSWMGQTSVERLHGRLDVLQTSFPPPPSWIQDGDAGNDVIQNLGRVFRSPLRRRRKMATLPLPVAILDDLIPGTGNWEWGHPRWRPEAEGPPSCASASMGVEKLALYYSPPVNAWKSQASIRPKLCTNLMHWSVPVIFSTTKTYPETC